MTQIDLTKLYKTQISLTEWFDKMGHPESEAMRAEDNEKRERLKVLNERIGLPFDRPHQFDAKDIIDGTPEFQRFLKEHGQELCALRLIPFDPKLPKLRMRGHTIEKALGWMAEQGIDPSQYRADFVPHSEKSIWSTIFVVNPHGVFGEIIAGPHHLLTQGFHEESKPIAFAYDFNRWLSPGLPTEAQEHLEEVIALLNIQDETTREQLIRELEADFHHHHLGGYFETVSSAEFGTWFIDYNRILGDLYNDFRIPEAQAGNETLKGQTGSAGKAQGKVRIVMPATVAETPFGKGEVLVCPMTTPDYIPWMCQAAAIVTDLGGILCHAAIVARELKKPCIIGTLSATQVLKNGDLVEVDADKGVVKIIKNG